MCWRLGARKTVTKRPGMVSALAPVRNSLGEIVGLIEVVAREGSAPQETTSWSLKCAARPPAARWGSCVVDLCPPAGRPPAAAPHRTDTPGLGGPWRGSKPRRLGPENGVLMLDFVQPPALEVVPLGLDPVGFARDRALSAPSQMRLLHRALHNRGTPRRADSLLPVGTPSQWAGLRAPALTREFDHVGSSLRKAGCAQATVPWGEGGRLTIWGADGEGV